MGCSYRILSCDGGGVRGILTARLLQRLVYAKPDLLSRVDLFAGTSTGALLSVGLAFGLTPAQLVELYRARSKEIFHQPFFRWFGGPLMYAKYGSTGMLNVLTDTFGNATLGDLKRKVFVTSLDLDSYDGHGRRSYRPKFFHNLDGDPRDLDAKLVDILMYSTAAPTFFPAFNGYVDGGLVANNPSVAALAQALDPKTLPQPTLQDICLMSIGTGKGTSYVPGQSNDWGFVRWAKTLVELLMSGSVEVADYECKQLLKSNYCRVNPYLDSDFRLDTVQHMDRMVESADNYDLTEHIKWLDTHL